MTQSDIELDLGDAIARLAQLSRRPRYALLVLQLIIEVAGPEGEAGPFVREPDGDRVTVREWLSRRLAPLSLRSDRRGRSAGEVGLRAALESADAAHLKPSVTASATNVSRAVSDLVRAGLVGRYYAGYATPHENRGAGRHAVYTLAPLMRPRSARLSAIPAERQGVLALGRAA